jgi:hypothetical protein
MHGAMSTLPQQNLKQKEGQNTMRTLNNTSSQDDQLIRDAIEVLLHPICIDHSELCGAALEYFQRADKKNTIATNDLLAILEKLDDTMTCQRKQIATLFEEMTKEKP